MENFDSFIEWVKSGEAQIQGGGADGQLLTERLQPLRVDNPESVTAEAYNLDVLPYDLPWEEGLARVRAAL